MSVDRTAALASAFPADFLWGVASAAYQIEGALTEDLRGESIWDRYLRDPGRVIDGSDGSVAADHYHRWREDVDLLSSLGLGAYRFSISWSRVLPSGLGPVNEAGLDFYERLVDRLLHRGIDPIVTLFHSDMPLGIQAGGGWFTRETSKHFARFAEIVAKRLGDRVKGWFTIAEPYTVMRLSYTRGEHAPGLRTPLGKTMTVAHHLLLGHGLATRAIRQNSKSRIGLTNHSSPTVPASDAPADILAHRYFDALTNHLVTDAVLLGRYPEALANLPDADFSSVRGGDFDIIQTPIDWLGLTYFHPTLTSAPKTAEQAALEPFDTSPTGGPAETTMGWPVVPAGLGDVIDGLRLRYGKRLPPLVIAENGCSLPDVPGSDGGIDDRARIEFVSGHLGALADAARRGIRIDGYFIWSFLDHFEWDLGFTKRWGIVHVDFDTQKRTPKASAYWYRDLIRQLRQ